MVDIKDLVKTINVEMNDKSLYETALTHRSYLNEKTSQTKEHNERMEFLGDAVLELIVTEYLYRNYNDPEGVLTNWRSALVKTESLSSVAETLGIEKYLRLSKGEKKGSRRARLQILANAIEAIIGAIYLDKGYEGAQQFVTDNIISTLPDILEEGSWRDAKTAFQELVQEQEGHTPEYEVISESGPDHDKRFIFGVYVDGDLRGQGDGASKQAAQQSAAKNALQQIEEANN
ncbi:MAG: ribonuclease III [Candidatus Saccharimonadales bacterium]